MYELKKISKESIPRALEKVDRYRLLNDPIEAESICRDILGIEPNHQKTLIKFILTLSDQFNTGASSQEALNHIDMLEDRYKQAYYTGIVHERLAKATLEKGLMDSKYDAFEYLEDAMEAFEKADGLSTPENKDAVLRWNACARTIEKYHLTKRPPERKDRLHLPLE